MSEKKHATSLHQKITQPLHTQNHTTSQQKTLRESQNAALRTSHRLSKVSNNSFQSTEKVLKKRKKSYSSDSSDSSYSSEKKITQPLKKFYFFQHFLKEQFDTFDNRCDVLRAAFCDSHNVSAPPLKKSMKNPVMSSGT